MQLLQPSVRGPADGEPAKLEARFPASALDQIRWRRWREWCFVRAAALTPWRSGGATGFGILTYHQVAPRREHDVQMLSVTPSRLRQQMEGLLRLGYRPLALRRAIELHREQTPPPKSFVVVFDDGYQGVYLHAWPVLQELQIPATVFLATAYLDQQNRFPFDAYRPQAAQAVSALPVTRAQCREMLTSGWVDLGSHTHTHQDFRDRAGEFRQDLETSITLLRSEFDCRDVPFAFPFGLVNDDLVQAAREAGVLCSLTTDSDLIRHDSDPYQWGRFGATQLDTAASLAAKLDGWYGRFRHLYRRVCS